MSKKSRKRNRRILGALAALGTGLALANRGKGTEMSNVSVDSGRGSGLRPTVDDVEFKESIVSTPVRTKTTIMDSMPARPKKNPLSKRVTDKGEVYTIKSASEGIPKKIGNKKSMFVGDKYIYQDQNHNTYKALYNNNPNSIEDITYYPHNSQYYEHPYERMAIEFESIIDN